MKKYLLFFVVMSLFSDVSQSANTLPIVKKNEFPAKLESQYNLYLALEDKTSTEAITIVKEGYKQAGHCHSQFPTDLVCRYFLGLFRGEMLSLKQLPIKSELHLMIADFNFVNERDASYDRAGAHRALGHLFLSLPGLPVLGSELKKDLVKAWQHAAKALQPFPNDTENLYLAGLIRLAENDTPSATLYFKNAMNNLGDYTGPKAEKMRLRDSIQKGLKQAQKSD